MDDSQRIQLSKLINEYDVEDTTTQIRKLKHSKQIMENVIGIQKLKNTYARIIKDDFNYFEEIAISRFNFLYTHYPEIFQRLIKDEVDINILSKLIMLLSYIEKGKLDQHEASYQVGLLLKNMYIDPALQERDAKEAEDNKNKYRNPEHKISWKDYKTAHISS